VSRLRIGVMHNINSRFGPKPLIHAEYMTGLAAGAENVIAPLLFKRATSGNPIQTERHLDLEFLIEAAATAHSRRMVEPGEHG
jgi:hypothetical protein